jgi:hypothetical protein
VVSTAGLVLTVMAHPDDAELWAGGTLAIHARAGAPVTIAVSRVNETCDREATVGAEALSTALSLLDELTVFVLEDRVSADTFAGLFGVAFREVFAPRLGIALVWRRFGVHVTSATLTVKSVCLWWAIDTAKPVAAPPR